VARFLDGPAEGVTLGLSRAPLFLRAVVKAHARPRQWDALDQLGDAPAPDEMIIAYRRVTEPVRAHINRGRRAGGCGWMEIADYRVVSPQPEERELRDNTAWRAWAMRQPRETEAVDGRG